MTNRLNECMDRTAIQLQEYRETLERCIDTVRTDRDAEYLEAGLLRAYELFLERFAPRNQLGHIVSGIEVGHHSYSQAAIKTLERLGR